MSQLTAAGWDGADVDDYVELRIFVADGYEADLDTLYIGTMSSLSGPGSIGVFTSDNDYSSLEYSNDLHASNLKFNLNQILY